MRRRHEPADECRRERRTQKSFAFAEHLILMRARYWRVSFAARIVQGNGAARGIAAKGRFCSHDAHDKQVQIARQSHDVTRPRSIVVSARPPST